MLVPFLAANVSLINFHISEQRDAVFLGHQLRIWLNIRQAVCK